MLGRRKLKVGTMCLACTDDDAGKEDILAKSNEYPYPTKGVMAYT
jgi:hypothetical protein